MRRCLESQHRCKNNRWFCCHEVPTPARCDVVGFDSVFSGTVPLAIYYCKQHDTFSWLLFFLCFILSCCTIFCLALSKSMHPIHYYVPCWHCMRLCTAAHHKCCVQLCILEIFRPKLRDAALTQAHMILYTKFANRFWMLLVVVEVYIETSKQRNKHFSNTRNSVPINTWISHRWAPRLWPSYCKASWLLCSTACNLHATWCNTQHKPGNNKQEDTMADFRALQFHSTLYHACYLTAATIAAYVGTSLARAKVLAYFCCCVPHLQARGA